MPVEKKGVGLKHYSQAHFLDHIAVICAIQKVPMILLDEPIDELIQKCYPDIDFISLDYHDFSPEYLISNYDYFISSHQWNRDTLKKTFEELEQAYGKPMRSIHIPHGFSDKAFYLSRSVDEDILLYYGQHMLDMFKNEGVIERIHQSVRIGNCRYTYYKMHKERFDTLISEAVLNKFAKKQTTILYAPTWVDTEQNSSYFQAAQDLFDKLPDHYNLIVKLHPRLEMDDTVAYYQLLGKYDSKPNIQFIKDMPLVYPILAASDIYLGDASSVGYDFLTFNRPMYFLNQRRMDFYLFRCGTVIPPEDYSSIYQRIQETFPKDAEKFSKTRKEVYDYTFGPELSFEEIKSQIDKCLDLT